MTPPTIYVGLHDHDLSEPVLEGRAPVVLWRRRRQHHAHWRLYREDLGSRHVLRQRQALLPAHRHRKEPHDPTVRGRICRLRYEVGYVTFFPIACHQPINYICHLFLKQAVRQISNIGRAYDLKQTATASQIRAERNRKFFTSLAK